jgi:beta-lactam-binding protein with PASTA domain
MSDGQASWQTSISAPPRRPSVGLLAGLGAMVAVLAAVGAVGGWWLAGSGGGQQSLRPTPSATAPTAGQSTSPTRSATATPTTAATAAPSDKQFVLPNFVGQDFEQVRRALRERGLGWRLVFATSGDDSSVERTQPVAGMPVRRGQTVTVFVRGMAPPVVVPDLVGQPCRQAQASLVDRGLYPQYPSGHEGRVGRQEPAGSTELRWNDRVLIYCEVAPVVPSYSIAP